MKRKTQIILLIGIIGALLTTYMIYERGVYSFWSQAGIFRLNADDAKTLLDVKKPTVLDVRDMMEYRVSHIPNAIRYEEGMLEALNPNEPILVYCTAALRSNSLAVELRAKGFSQVYELKGGILHWKNKAYELVNEQGHKTDSLHTYNRWLSPFLTNGKAIY